MALDLAHFNTRARQAVATFWASRLDAAARQHAAGRTDQGERAGVTSGGNMDGFVDLIAALVEANGLDDAEVHVGRGTVTLPGYFRPTKDWDILVRRHDKLIAAIELKSHVGPSFGNNANNRAEEAVGTALDLWTAFREGAFGKQPRPFVGWMVLVEDAPDSRRAATRELSRYFPIFPEFQGASYLDRYEILCHKLIQENLYTEAAVIASTREGGIHGDYTELSATTSLWRFAVAFAGHVAAEAASRD